MKIIAYVILVFTAMCVSAQTQRGKDLSGAEAVCEQADALAETYNKAHPGAGLMNNCGIQITVFNDREIHYPLTKAEASRMHYLYEKVDHAVYELDQYRTTLIRRHVPSNKMDNDDPNVYWKDFLIKPGDDFITEEEEMGK